MAAFLVLVGGVAQILVGGGQAALVADAPSRATLSVELATWNLACAATVIGTLIASPQLTTLGGVALIASLVVFLAAVLKHGAPRLGENRVRRGRRVCAAEHAGGVGTGLGSPRLSGAASRLEQEGPHPGRILAGRPRPSP